MANVHIAFEIIDSVKPNEMRKGKIRAGYGHVIVHIIFDINMDEKFTINVRLVADGHTKISPSLIKYSSAVSRKSVRTLFLFVSSIDLEIFACNIVNA